VLPAASRIAINGFYAYAEPTAVSAHALACSVNFSICCYETDQKGVGLFQCNARRQHICCPLSPRRNFGSSVLGAASNKIHQSSWRRKRKLKMARAFAITYTKTRRR
jgi:hypothetical protein